MGVLGLGAGLAGGMFGVGMLGAGMPLARALPPPLALAPPVAPIPKARRAPRKVKPPTVATPIPRKRTRKIAAEAEGGAKTTSSRKGKGKANA